MNGIDLKPLFAMLGENAKPLTVIAGGVILGRIELFAPENISLAKDIVSIIATLGGFIILVYNSFFKKAK
jgi:hypothetical protein